MSDILASQALRRLALCALAGFAAGVGPLQASLIEEQNKVPVKVADNYGREISHDIVVTIFHDDTAPKPYPALVLNHGRAATRDGRLAVGRARYSVASRWLAGMGFMVAVPTRVGYGVTGGEDVEDTGSCFRKNYPPGYTAAAVQTLAVLETLRLRPEVSKDRAVVMGQSFGGATAITVAALNPPGVQAAVNFAGGGGGDPKGRPQAPCRPDLLEKMFADYGRTARIPTLWIYTENDMYFGPRLPREWFDAFKAAGGTGEYIRFPAHGESGHGLFTSAPGVWQPGVSAFLRAHGYPALPPVRDARERR